MFKIAVLLVTYNPDWNKFRRTLYSIISQKNVEISLIIADDGSENDCFDFAEGYLKNNGFTSYKFVKNIKNLGTVKNILSGLSIINEKYVKLISPGDFLYDEDTLAEFCDFAEKNPAAFYFGNMFYYSLDKDNSITIYEDKKNPRDLRPWKKMDAKKIRWNYLVNRDYVCGAVSVYNTQKLSEYLMRISSFVKFAEDCSMIYMIANKESAYYTNTWGGYFMNLVQGFQPKTLVHGLCV